MLFFRSEEMLGEWCHETRLPRREVLTLPQIWELARAWYGDRLTRLQPRSRHEMREVFTRIGLIGPFWELPD